MRKPLAGVDDDEEMKDDESDEKAVAVQDDPSFTLAVTRGNVINIGPRVLANPLSTCLFGWADYSQDRQN